MEAIAGAIGLHWFVWLRFDVMQTKQRSALFAGARRQRRKSLHPRQIPAPTVVGAGICYVGGDNEEPSWFTRGAKRRRFAEGSRLRETAKSLPPHAPIELN